MLKPGSPAPDFALSDSKGTQHALRTLLSTGPVVLMFYPADNTPLCTKQNCMVRDRFAELEVAGVRVVGISPQSAEVKAAFASGNRLPQLLLVDKGSKVAALYGARGLFGLPLPLGTRRMSFLVRIDAVSGPLIEHAAHQEFGLTAHELLLDNALRLAKQWGSEQGPGAHATGAKGAP
jgi:thioredoxin-dependent peroxiredoxin